MAGGSVYAALSQRGATIEVAVAATSLPAGTVLGPADVRAVGVSAAAGAITRAVFSPADVPYGWVTAVGVRAGDPLTPDVLSMPVSGAAGQMSIAVPEAQAAGGTLVPGDEVDMILASPRRSRYVATGLRVVGTSAGSSGGLLSGAGPGYDVVVQVSRRTALEVATALAASSGTGADQVELVRSQPLVGAAGRLHRGAKAGSTGARRD